MRGSKTKNGARSRTGWGVGLQGRDGARLSDFVRPTIFHINRGQQEHIALFGDTRGNSLHDLAIDRLLVISHEVLVEKLLNLVRRKPGRDQCIVIEGYWGFTYIQQMS